ncbi:membrane protein DedA with SNARE-associated domain [Tamaricihabitans halophyticus]|uniref:Membrane protein DedA with SNARE-associated domain n=1 Tax=Tamaricihabitans halophyticus TaxID=1262583 RepID=A0A4R2QWU8_9PSEU|nr:VTT domain-containing protein [Tamaricihabitans halophyticus]TCP54187.1 membrane protein DedA with SNARE-associated domain [Tamaricihabitans halophyticus]
MSGTYGLALDWSDSSTIGYPTLFGGVLLGSIVPIVPTGAVVGAAAAVAVTTSHLSLPVVLLLSVLGALVGDVATYLIARLGTEPVQRWLRKGSHPERLANGRAQFAKHGWQIIVLGRLLPAGRIPVLIAAAATGYPWRRLLPSMLAACTVWACAYAVLGVASGGVSDSPLIAVLVATVLVLLITVVTNLVSRHRRARRLAKQPQQHYGGAAMTENQHDAG